MPCTPAFALLVLGMCPLATATSSFLRSYKVTEKDADASLSSELADVVDHARLGRLEDELRTTYRSLPKNGKGNLDHKTVRYVLHRLFVQRHGWYVKGLEPGRDALTVAEAGKIKQEWVPSFLQTHLEQKVGQDGAGLRELAVLAAALEDLIRKEALGRLQTAYEAHGVAANATLSRAEARDIVDTYFIAYLLAGNVTIKNTEDLRRKKSIFQHKYTNYADAEQWFNGVLDSVLNTSGSQVDFDVTGRLAVEIGEKYHTFNDLECRSLKTTLQGMEDKRAGRVRLSLFYKMGLYSHWRFTEKAAYLRTLGALDETDPRQPLVIVPNYLMSRSNCLEATGMYALCCRNECEDIMSQLEAAVGAPSVQPGRILDLVSGMASDTVEAPRELPSQLRSRLAEVSRTNGGEVPLHGRLFAQWMHHAFPRECPYPHEVGTTSPLTAEEWMLKTGHDSHEASEEELQRHAATETCSIDADGKVVEVRDSSPHAENEDVELPWTVAEELLTERHVPQTSFRFSRLSVNTEGGRASFTLSGTLAFLLSAVLAATLIIDARGSSAQRRSHAMRGIMEVEAMSLSKMRLRIDERMRLPLLVASLASASYALGLLDGSLFVCAVFVGPGLLACRHALERHARASKSNAKAKLMDEP